MPPNPGLTIATAPISTQPPPSSPSRSSSPTRPPISPLTPTGPDPPSNPFAAGRPTFTHASQADQTAPAVAVPPPAPPIDFDDNPDVLALRSAISILQLQRGRAARDIAALGRAKADALADPDAFLADLRAGRVGSAGDRLFPDARPRAAAVGGGEAAEGAGKGEGDEDDDDDSEDDGDGEKISAAEANSKAWHALPQPQNVVRCPPINWSQYGVVGESLDKLHAEQQRAPTQGVPATLGPGGTFEFKAGDQQPPPGEQRKLVGVAAPYAPGRDKLDKKAKGPRK